MESKTMSSILKLACVLVFLAGFATSDIDKDKEKCANQLVGLATCLPYVTGQAKSPQKECCTGLKQVIQNSPECMCLLVKDKDDPSLGFKINATLALSLPSQCQAPANASDCPRLLHLPPNSPDAKVFDDFANAANKICQIEAFDLIIVGRRHKDDTPQLLGLSEWNDLPELGPVGDMLSAADISKPVSVMVIQHQNVKNK